jgi:hypothetical protein
MTNDTRSSIAPDQVRTRQDLTVTTASSWGGPAVSREVGEAVFDVEHVDVSYDGVPPSGTSRCASRRARSPR